jgi:endonuclease YncB( thermonuclease family)
MLLRFIALFLCLLHVFPSLHGQTRTAFAFTGKVVKIVDGDTFDILDSLNKVSRIRMNGIDAPEKKQAFGQQSKDMLGRWCFAKTVQIKVYSKDKNGRSIADSYINGRSLSLLMIQEGMAWHFKKYSKDTVLAKAEINARAARKGLWTDPAPVPPWQYRASR